MKSRVSLDGILPVDKASGMTSHDVVAIVRRAFSTKKVGHCGTLDPLATGLLLVTIGKGTKIQDLLMSEDKEYIGTLRLGSITDSQDAEGAILERRSVPHFSALQIEKAFCQLTGDFYQIPPMVSAIKRNGVPLYRLAREGKNVERTPRFVHVHAFEILSVRLPEVDFCVECSKGFYVRTYAHDIGMILGCGAYLQSLRRTRSGKFSLHGATTVEEVKNSSWDLLKRRVLSLPVVSRLRSA
ncbi:tRNA pseudouridine synthase B [Candidatus Xiphinematobacter sp. Idaho Grape]|uniref:tRNA pseudouridine(55) synthase TruB n=1 Tax=Candidatus Xiphinematobacter sp. Idaho Grape TaxID=1704307 RepID=UPI00070594BF|nr:tRNA pseudouridine(55) synthase TruB [Candidatus Xiphinematobacter sp. Idaho Grape]ALJ56335.1 tRNA pseudouridine synthase B [Candidatus Xiphinematobacter sp. Idaho Grape]